MYDILTQTLSNPAVWAAAAVVILIHWIVTSGRPGSSRFPPGPWGWPIIGNLGLLSRAGNPSDIFNELSKTYGGLIGVKLGSVPAVFLCGTKELQKVFTDTESASRPHNLQALNFLGGGEHKGILMNVGDKHKEIRRFVLLSLRNLGVGTQGLEGKVSIETDAMIDRFREESSGDGVLNSKTLMETITSGANNIVITIIQGQRYDYKDPAFVKLMENVIKILSFNPIGDPANFFPAVKYFPFIKSDSDVLPGLIISIKDLLSQRLEEHRSSFDAGNIRDYMDFCIEQESKDSSISMESAFQTMFELFLAGTDTVSSSMIWIIFFLAKFPELHEKAYLEVKQAIGIGREVVWRDRKETPLVEAFINESLRLGTPVVTTAPHQTTGPIEAGEYCIPKGTVVIANLRSCHMDPEVWDQADEFRPERFINDEGLFSSPRNFYPFGEGPRSCIGQNLARMELFMITSTLLQKVEFRTAPGAPAFDMEAVERVTRIPADFQVQMVSRY